MPSCGIERSAGPTSDVEKISNSAALLCPHVLSLQTFGTLGYLELHPLALSQGFESTGSDGRQVDEHVLTLVAADEAVAFI
jgi:hypothetical protein